jgi:hypothetical protein
MKLSIFRLTFYFSPNAGHVELFSVFQDSKEYDSECLVYNFDFILFS